MKQEDESLLSCSALSQYSSNAFDDLVYLNLLPNKEARLRGARIWLNLHICICTALFDRFRQSCGTCMGVEAKGDEQQI